ncbi:murein biosynthesis integral membrane protein MurJ [Corynebacterium sp. P8-C1]|uniref:murein biosynthesis integral membrane protein MurJ n=1 Tax=Corynebacterium sp. P8-C1 TaxID=3059082 RepID=UPI00265D52D5|nr:murein biosynthesis integral membrane protein MurJ [Corynebacterium sp. P8-C1]WKK62595.1 murein biosynthesis integral membrane protein MurJ [Corynebacterium sp. P8-C1]
MVDQPVAAAEEKKTTSDNSVVRSTGSMAVATLMSRITGFIRTVMITSALGGAVASAFNTANTLPNMITEIVLGSVLTALVVPVLVRAEKEDPDRGAAFIRRLFTLTVTLLTAVTLLTVVGAPLLTELMLDEDGHVNLVQATSFAYLLLPQIMFYGLFSLFMAILNTKEVFRPGAWAPVANNLVSIGIMVLYMILPGQLDPKEHTGVTDPHILLLGLGTTLGVAVQCLIMLPALRRLKIDLRPLWGIDERLKQFGGMALAIVTYVAISQVGYIINNRIASGVDGSAPVIYMQHWQLLQVPYGIVGVTLLTAIMPRLSRNAADGDDEAVVRDLTLGTKLTFLALIPIIIFMTALGPDIGNALFGYGNFTNQEARTLGLTLSFSAFTLIPYALVMLHLRVFYAREEAWTPTFIIAGITLTKVVLAVLAPTVASRPDQVVVLLGAANGFGFVAGAVIGAYLLRRKLGSLNSGSVLHTSVWAAAAGLVGVATAMLVRFLLRFIPGGMPGLAVALGRRDSFGLLLEILILGVVFVIATGVALSFSKLPEVRNLGAALARIPGLGRIVRTSPSDQIPAGEVDPQEASVQIFVADTFNASPIPPPMSAGVVRGPRLVPGAAVSDGRFRLLRDYGASASARFWQAREQATGRMVALTFVDTCGAAPLAPVSPRQAAIDAAGICHRTNQLAALNLPAVAPVIETVRYRTGCVVVAEWVPGSDLKTVADSGATLLDEAVASAMLPLTETMAQAHERGVALGLDNRNRMRVSDNGTVVLAFPAVLPDADIDADVSAYASALELLAGSAETDALDSAVLSARNTGSETGNELPDYRAIGQKLAAISGAGGPEGTPAPARLTSQQPHQLDQLDQLEQEDSGHTARRGGFGERGLGTLGTAGLVAVAITAVVLVATLTVYLVGMFSTRPDSPITNESARDGAEQVSEGIENAPAGRLPVIIAPLNASTWGENRDDSSRSTDFAALVDGNDTTAASAAAGEKILITAGTETGDGAGSNAAFIPEELIIDTATATTTADTSGGLNYTVYGINEQTGDATATATDINHLPVLSDGTLKNGRTNIEIGKENQGNAAPVTGLVISFSAPADDENWDGSAAVIRGVTVVGTRMR